MKGKKLLKDRMVTVMIWLAIAFTVWRRITFRGGYLSCYRSFRINVTYVDSR